MLDDSDDTDDDSEEGIRGLHTMVAIGHRFTTVISGQKKYWFLLQNTWKQMPLIEVSAEYLMEHLKHPSGVNGELLWLHGDLSNIPTTLSFCGGLFQEAAFDDGGEDYDEEMDDRQLEGKK